jgi:hypothetical protein
MNSAQRYQRVKAVEGMLAEGKTRKQIAEVLNVSYQVVANIVRQYALQAVHGGRRHSDPRADRMAAMYRGGCTLAAIGKEFNLTRERVRQLLKKYHGITAPAGGASLLAQRRRASAATRRDGRCMAKYGCTFDQWRQIMEIGRQMMADGASRSRTPMGAFSSQRRNAECRGIEWKLKFWDWWQFWLQSGKWESRGRGQGYCMCRIGDAGAYELGNIYIATNSENIRTYQLRRWRLIRAEQQEAA